MSVEDIKEVLDKSMKIKIDETERYPFITFEKVADDYPGDEFECVMLVDEDSMKRWTQALIEFEKMQTELGDLQEQFRQRQFWQGQDEEKYPKE